MPVLSEYLARARTAKIAPYVKGDVLDLGCGNATTLSQYAHQITSYCGIERSQPRVDSLSQQYPHACFIVRDLDRDRLQLDRQFDCVLMIALIEHLFNQKHVMDEVALALKPGGVVVITTPTPFGNDVIHRLGAAIGLFYREAMDDHIVIYNFK